jgi:hypothetical protein
MALSSTPAVLQGCILGTAVITSGDGTSPKTIYSVGPNGVFIETVVISTGPTTAPGGTYTVVLEIYDGTTNTCPVKVITLVNTVDTIQDTIYLGINLATPAELRIESRTALTAGATVKAVMTGRSY